MADDKVHYCRLIAMVMIPLSILITFIVVLTTFQNNVLRTTSAVVVNPSNPSIIYDVDPHNILTVNLTLYHFDISAARQAFVFAVKVDTPDFWKSGFTNRYNFSIQIGTFNQKFTKVVNGYQCSVPVSSGSVYYYPIDDYEAKQLTVYYVIEDTNLNGLVDDGLVDLPYLNVTINTRNQYSWNVDINTDPTGYNDAQFRIISIYAVRSQLFRLYPIFLIIAFWIILSGMIFYVSAVLLWELSPINAGFVGMIGGMFFPLVNFRGTAPLAPPIGCILDFASFFWAILTTVVMGFLLWNKYTMIKKPPAPAPKN